MILGRHSTQKYLVGQSAQIEHVAFTEPNKPYHEYYQQPESHSTKETYGQDPKDESWRLKTGRIQGVVEQGQRRELVERVDIPRAHMLDCNDFF